MLGVFKSATKSVTIWGAVATVVVAAGSILGWDLEEATVREILEAAAVVVGGVALIVVLLYLAGFLTGGL